MDKATERMTPSRLAALEFLEMGLDAIPLQPLSKRALLAGWRDSEPAVQWESAPEVANIGIRCGGKMSLCVIDSDDKKRPTWRSVQNHLWGLGLEPGCYPSVFTPNGGRHAYFLLDGTLEGNYRILNPEVGAGEFRYGKGAYVAAPPSQLETGSYSLIEGDFHYLPTIRKADILPLLARTDSIKVDAEANITKPSRFAYALLQGKGIEKYPSRSEAEQAILTSMVNVGMGFHEVLELFIRYPAAGKFQELHKKNPSSAIQWLNNSYQKALDYAQTHESQARKNAKEQIEWARSISWPGRTGSTDRAVYLAHASIAYRAGKTIYAASSRTLAELAGVSRPTAEHANHRLQAKNLIKPEENAIAEQATKYRLVKQDISTSYKPFEGVDKAYITSHDAFRHAGLGKSAGEVYALLLEEPLTAGELATRTGRHITTVNRVLNRMGKLIDIHTGEIIGMVEPLPDKRWKALPVNLDEIARLYGTYGTLKKQKEKHKAERTIHKRSLQIGTDKPVSSKYQEKNEHDKTRQN